MSAPQGYLNQPTLIRAGNFPQFLRAADFNQLVAHPVGGHQIVQTVRSAAPHFVEAVHAAPAVRTITEFAEEEEVEVVDPNPQYR